MKTKNICYLALLLTVFIGCKKETKSTISNEADYASFINSEQFTKAETDAYSNFEYWNKKFIEAPDQHLYLSKLASSQALLFETTADISHLKFAEKYLLQLNDITKYKNPNHLQSLAHNYISQHRFKEALDLLHIAENIGDELKATQKMLFDVHLELGNSNKAGEYLEKIKNFSDFDYLLRLAKWSDHNSDLQSAIKYMEKATAIAESSNLKSAKIWSYTNIADFYGHDGQIEKAYNYYLKSLELDPSNSYAKKGIAWIVFSKEKNSAEAKKIINSILKNSNAPDYYLLLAEIAEFENNTAEKDAAIKKYWEAINNEAYGDMYNVYSANLYLDSNPDKALELAKIEVDNRPTALSYALYAHSLLNTGQKEKALDVLESKVIGYTTEPNALITAAHIYKANNLSEKLLPIKEELLDSSFEIGPVSTNTIKNL